MDAYLSREAHNSLLGLNLVASKTNMDGILIGHKRGQRLFVEKILPTKNGFFPSYESYLALDKHFQGNLVGFFTFKFNEKKIKKILSPFAFGQLLLNIHPTKKNKMTIKSYVIDYKKDFFLSPVDLKLPE